MNSNKNSVVLITFDVVAPLKEIPEADVEVTFFLCCMQLK
jgi:hypothetical protein